jgi:hypothetical protein
VIGDLVINTMALHGTFRPEFLDDAGPLTSIDVAHAAVDAWVHEYSTDRPHQALDDKLPVTPAERFAPAAATERDVLPLWLPPALEAVAAARPALVVPDDELREVEAPALPAVTSSPRGPGMRSSSAGRGRVGNLSIRGQQFWLGRPRSCGSCAG